MPIEGKRNIADIFTKEEKDDQLYCSVAYTITTLHLLQHWNPLTGKTLDDDGNIEQPGSKYQREKKDPCLDLPILPDIPVNIHDLQVDLLGCLDTQNTCSPLQYAVADRGVLKRACSF